jgi:hypothetical protein
MAENTEDIFYDAKSHKTYDTKKYNSKYNKKLAEQEEYCEACRIHVKRISLPNHKKGKKHLEAEKKFTEINYEIIYDKIFYSQESLEKDSSKENVKKVIMELYKVLNDNLKVS